MKKWGKEYWVNMGERAGASAVGGVLTMVTVDSTGIADYSPRAWWVIVGIPTATAVLKGLLANFGSSNAEPTASMVTAVKSNLEK